MERRRFLLTSLAGALGVVGTGGARLGSGFGLEQP